MTPEDVLALTRRNLKHLLIRKKTDLDFDAQVDRSVDWLRRYAESKGHVLGAAEAAPDGQREVVWQIAARFFPSVKIDSRKAPFASVDEPDRVSKPRAPKAPPGAVSAGSGPMPTPRAMAETIRQKLAEIAAARPFFYVVEEGERGVKVRIAREDPEQYRKWYVATCGRCEPLHEVAVVIAPPVGDRGFANLTVRNAISYSDEERAKLAKAGIKPIRAIRGLDPEQAVNQLFSWLGHDNTLVKIIM